MKTCFPGYLPKSQEEYDLIWDNCTFVFDTNILLNMYRYSKETQNVFFTILDRIHENVWIPHQVVKEFFKNRTKVIIDQKRLYKTILEIMKFDNIKSQLNQYKDRHHSIRIMDILQIIEQTEVRIKEELDESQSEEANYLEDDVILNKLLDIFDGKVGEPYSESKLADLYKTAQKRYKHKIPPGFKDEAKDEPDKYNDYIVWSQIIDYAKKEKSNIILVTDDKKEDWWQPTYEGKTLGPRSELLDEMYKEAETQCLIYKTGTFLDYAKGKFVAVLDGILIDNAIGEVESLGNNFVAESAVKDLEELGFTIQTLQRAVNDCLNEGEGQFSTKDIVKKLTGEYRVGNRINRVIGVILSEMQESLFSILPDGRISFEDDFGKSTTSACWKCISGE